MGGGRSRQVEQPVEVQLGDGHPPVEFVSVDQQGVEFTDPAEDLTFGIGDSGGSSGMEPGAAVRLEGYPATQGVDHHPEYSGRGVDVYFAGSSGQVGGTERSDQCPPETLRLVGDTWVFG